MAHAAGQAYMVDAVPLMVTIDPFAVSNDQVLIQALDGHPSRDQLSEDGTIEYAFSPACATRAQR